MASRSVWEWCSASLLLQQNPPLISSTNLPCPIFHAFRRSQKPVFLCEISSSKHWQQSSFRNKESKTTPGEPAEFDRRQTVLRPSLVVVRSPLSHPWQNAAMGRLRGGETGQCLACQEEDQLVCEQPPSLFLASPLYPCYSCVFPYPHHCLADDLPVL